MFKKLFLIALLGCSSSILSMDKPYKPSFSARHPIIARTLKSVSAGMATSAVTYAGSEYFESKNGVRDSLLTGAAIAAGVWLHDTFKKPHLLDSVLCDPKRALNYAHKMGDKMKAEAKKKGLLEASNTDPRTLTLIQRYENECPFLLLGECVSEGWGPCALSRSSNSKYRNEYENTLCGALLQKLEAAQRPVIYTSVGCGGTFQDLVILTKLLAKKPNAHLIINLVDLQHTPYVACCDALNNNRQTTLVPIDPNSVMPQLITRAKTEWGGFANETDNAIERNLAEAISLVDAKSKELLKWLQANFPRATITLFMHDSVKSYCDSLDNKNLAYPDVLTAADIQDEMSLLRRSMLDYLTLCSRTLSKNPSSINILLAKNPRKPVGDLLTVSLQESQQAEKEEFEGSDKAKHAIYIKTQPL